MQVFVYNDQKDFHIESIDWNSIAKAALSLEGQKADEVSLHFVTKQTICELHDQFFDDPSPTDCISLPMDPPEEQGYRVLGEIFICPQVAIEYAEEYNIDKRQEVILYAVHGLLHLMGYRDNSENDEKLMRQAEAKQIDYLRSLKII